MALFDDGRRLVTEGRYAEACPKFVESHRLDPAPGTLLNLGDCYEKNGQTASAWGAFDEAVQRSRKEGDQGREAEARRRGKLLEPRLARLDVVVPPESQAPDLEVRRDGQPIARGLWGTAIPVDPGPHTVEAMAPGKKPFLARAEVKDEPDTLTVSVPVLEVALAPRSSAPENAPASPWSGRRTAGLVVGGVGVVGGVLGAVFGVQAGSKNRASREHCLAAQPNLCDPQGVGLRQDAKTAATVSNVAFGIGAAALVGGAVVFFTAPSGGAPKKSGASLWIGPSGVVLQGAW